MPRYLGFQSPQTALVPECGAAAAAAAVSCFPITTALSSLILYYAITSAMLLDYFSKRSIFEKNLNITNFQSDFEIIFLIAELLNKRLECSCIQSWNHFCMALAYLPWDYDLSSFTDLDLHFHIISVCEISLLHHVYYLSLVIDMKYCSWHLMHMILFHKHIFYIGIEDLHC